MSNDIDQLRVEKLTIQKLLEEDFYSIPEYQRDYVWDEDNIFNYIDDIMYNFDVNNTVVNPTKNIKKWSSYYLGNIVLAEDKSDNTSRVQIIDGQQRVTTTIIFSKVLLDFCNNKELFENSKSIESFSDILQSFLGGFDPLTRETKHRLLFLYKENQEFFQLICENGFDFLDKYDQRSLTESQKNLINAYLLLYEKIYERVENESLDQSEFENLLSYFTNYIVFSSVYADNISTALYIFQNLNNRGVGLTPSDLLKNLLLMNTSNQTQVDKITKDWRELTTKIEEGNKKNKNITINRFIRHYIMSKFGKPGLKVDQVFSYIQDNTQELGISKDPAVFLSELKEKANDYVGFFNGKDRHGNELEALQNMRDLRFLGQMLLLLFSNGVPSERFQELCEKIENLMFVYTITGKLTKDFEALFCSWALKIKEINSEESYNLFIENDYVPELKSQYTKFVDNFKTLSQNGQTKYRQKYILAKLGQLLEEAVSGKGKSTSRKTIETQYKEIEHILPQTPEPELLETFIKDLDETETYEDYVKRFGNLTLLDKPLNIVASNNFYEEKKEIYVNDTQDFKLTKAIATDLKIGSGTRLDNLVKDCQIQKFDNWTKDSIIERQQQLTNLAIRVWGLK